MNSTTLLIGGLGGTELIIILAVLVLLFGASKLPELARGSGQALRIFKDETKGLTESSDAEKPTSAALLDNDKAVPVALIDNETPASAALIDHDNPAQRG